MEQRRYTYEEKKNIITTFLRRRKTEGISLRWYSSEIEIPYYTIRDMYSNRKINLSQVSLSSSSIITVEDEI